MAKKKLSKEQKLREKCAASYDAVMQMVGINPIDDDVPAQVRKLVFAANDILTEICQNADKIKIDLFEEVKEIVPIDVTRWKEFVDLSARTTNGTISDDTLQKYEDKFQESQYIINLRASFIKSYVQDGTEAKLPDKDTTERPEVDMTYSNPDFEKLLIDATRVRIYLNQVLWPAFNQMREAAMHITDMKLQPWEFKDLVDWEHYKRGGYPNENSKPKLWSIFNRFDYALRLMEKYGFTQQNKLLKKFGLEVELEPAHATRDVFTEASDVLVGYTIYKPINQEARDAIHMLSDELVLSLCGMVAIFDRDTRVIRRILPFDELVSPWYELGNEGVPITCEGVKDTGEWLVLDEVTWPMYIENAKDIGWVEILHPENHDYPNTSKRQLSPEEKAILGDDGYYGAGPED